MGIGSDDQDGCPDESNPNTTSSNNTTANDHNIFPSTSNIVQKAAPTKTLTFETESPPTNIREAPTPTTTPTSEFGSPPSSIPFINIDETSTKEQTSKNGSPSSSTINDIHIDETSMPTKSQTSENESQPSSSKETTQILETSTPTKEPPSEGSPTQRRPVVWLRSCDAETVTPIEGKVIGKIPSWLNGRLTRNGPGKIHFGDTWYNHLFDGSAYLHQFNIKDGRVTYQSRFLQSNTYKKNSSANRIVVSEFGTVACPDPCKTLLQRFMSVFEPPGKNSTDNCSVNVVYMGDELYAMTETPNIRRLDPDTLDCIGDMTKLNNYIAVNQATAHPHVDPDGTVYNMGNSYDGKNGPSYNILKFPPPKDVDGHRVSSFEQAEIVASIPCQWKMYPSYYHSFGITDNYFVFVEMPFVFNVKKFLFYHYFGKPMFGALDWFPNEKTKFRIVRRDTGELIKTVYKTDAFLTFHHTNAYEKEGHLVVDLCGISDAGCVYQLMLKNFENPDFEASPCTMSTHRRFVIPLDVTEAEEDTNLVTLQDTKCSAYKRQDHSVELVGEEKSDVYFDLPRINYKHNGKEYSYAYGVELNTKGVEFCSLLKLNVKTGETKRWENGEKLVSEPVFVEAPDAQHEDQGVVLSALIDKLNPKYTALLVLDAKSWTELGRVEFEANGEVPSTFHGMFAASGELVHRY
ncbi:carotenoid-cleaving dioxygenase, mitochondrial-like [Palaemon carinicauda]|uniref:carotenoid-cleaving dioxygenase, mitochondrial-like n=1 Tax=Palaemon carinicauda TaxID=392227 RepID=UPI0035B57AF2